MNCRKLSNRSVLYFDEGEAEAALLLEDACVRSQSVIREAWGLQEPAECRIYVVTSWLQFLFHSAPWHRRIIRAMLLPLWYRRVSQSWRFSGGWTLPHSKRPAVGIKPPRLIAETDRGLAVSFSKRNEI